ncbi:peptidoglycan-binding protein [Bacillus lacus]|uniref:Peptidoglycan-binding protein n=1 Tax=Metabacillus lacus TaxID=1983721 RepID=A0A7X2IYY5_9BACI|nr:peptidoglycan-binding protein [Metabacillus lacus]MRX72362.1 peptidoglycan-binding protein [Metabacillus lacus]
MKKWKSVSVAAIASAALLFGAPAVIHAADSPQVMLFKYPSKGLIKEGARGHEVQVLQGALNKVIKSNLSPDGVYGPKTSQAVLAYQKSKSFLANDGIYGPRTHKALTEDYFKSDLPNEILKPGSKGQGVLALQRALNDLSYNVKEDGIYGTQTKEAVIKFQKRFSSLTADGIYGPKTKDVLEKVLND